MEARLKNFALSVPLPAMNAHPNVPNTSTTIADDVPKHANDVQKNAGKWLRNRAIKMRSHEGSLKQNMAQDFLVFLRVLEPWWQKE